MNVELIDRADDLRKFIEKFSALPFIGIDTEFEKLRTSYSWRIPGDGRGHGLYTRS